MSMFERMRYQFGYVRQKPRKTGPHVWVWEYRDRSSSHSVILGTVEEMSEVEAWKATESRRLIINDPQSADQTSFGAVVDRYIREALPEREVTRSRYLSWINCHIKPKWRDSPIAEVKPLAVELWIRDLKLAGRSKGHIRDMMHLLFNWAMRWELTQIDRNPMSLVRVKGSSKRTKIPRILTIKEFNLLFERLKEPYRTMALVALFLGPRVSEVVGLKWNDVDWEGIFANPETGNPYWPSKIRENHLVPAGIAAGIGRVGWHTFRHTYSCLLREHEVDVKVQQALLRHADIRTTMNIYTQAIPKAVREATRRVVRSIMGKKAALRRQ